MLAPIVMPELLAVPNGAKFKVLYPVPLSPHFSQNVTLISYGYTFSHMLRYLHIFLERWRARQPVIVRGMKGRMQWGPEVMQRATREQGNKRFNTDSADTHLQVREGRGGGRRRRPIFAQISKSSQYFLIKLHCKALLVHLLCTSRCWTGRG